MSKIKILSFIGTYNKAPYINFVECLAFFILLYELSVQI